MARKSRSSRWVEAAVKATEGLQELVDIQQEYEEWLENLPEGLENSNLGEKLQAVVDLELSYSLEQVMEAEAADLPLGFGRD